MMNGYLLVVVIYILLHDLALFDSRGGYERMEGCYEDEFYNNMSPPHINNFFPQPRDTPTRQSFKAKTSPSPAIIIGTSKYYLASY